MLDMVKYESNGQQIQFTAQDVRDRLCPNINDGELSLVMALCQAQNLNPFTRDVYVIKYGSAPASIVTGKEVFTKRAAANPDYQGFEAGITYADRQGNVKSREGSAVYKAAGETLLGGWCRVYVAGRKPVYDEVSLDEYSTGKSGWAKMPATMIRKVALVHCLREAFPSDFQGLYCSEEMGKAGEIAASAEERESAPLPVEVQAVELQSAEQAERLRDLLEETAKLYGRSVEATITAVLDTNTVKAFDVRGLEDLDAQQAEAVAAMLEHWNEKKRPKSALEIAMDAAEPEE